MLGCRIRWSLFASAVMLATTGQVVRSSPKHTNNIVYHPPVILGLQTFQSGPTCISLYVYTEDSFFEDLEKIETPTGPKFRRKSTWFTEFPDTILLVVDASRKACPRDRKSVPRLQERRESDQRLEPDQLRFQAEFITGAAKRPAEITSVEFQKEPWQELRDDWSYKLTLKSKGAALTNELLITVKSDTGQQLARFSKKL